MRETSNARRLAVVLATLGALACTHANATEPDGFASDEERQAYSLGVALGQQASQGLGEIDDEAFIAGIRDAISGADLALSPEALQSALVSFDERRIQQVEAEFAAIAEANRVAGNAFRAQFAADEDVKTLDSGVAYKVLTEGEGEVPAEDATVTIHYKGSLINGDEFDSSYARGEPVSIPLKGVIEGFSQALSRMPEGSKWQVVIPPELAYGAEGAGPIGPNSTLVFEMEMISAG